MQVNVLRLSHPSIVKLKAVSLKPEPTLLLEFAEYGTLCSYIASNSLSRQLKHKIGLQVHMEFSIDNLFRGLAVV